MSSHLTAIVYASTATRTPSQSDLEALLLDARAFNAHSEVTGVLLVTGSRFLQYFEGPPLAVEAVFKRIVGSSLHKDIQILYHGTVKTRAFQTWHMGLAHVPDSAYLDVAQADWQSELSSRQDALRSRPALAGLVATWRQFGAGGQLSPG